MKRKLVLFSMLLLFSFALAGCDFFGQNTTLPTIPDTTQSSTTVGSTTQATTVETTAATTLPTTAATTVPTTAATTVETTAIPTTQTTTVSTTVTTTTTTSATTTTTTTVTTTQTPTTTTTAFITVTTQYTTTTTLTTLTSTGTTSITTTTVPTTIPTTQTTTSTTNPDFDRQDLIDLVISRMGGTPTELQVEAEIAFYKELLGITVEEDLYNLLVNLDAIISDFDLISGLSEFKSWYENTKMLGFDKTLVTNMMINFVRKQIDNEVENYDPNQFEDDINQYLANINAFQLEQDQLGMDVANYCTYSTTDTTDCINYYQESILVESQFVDYQTALSTYSSANSDLWDNSTYDRLNTSLDNLIYVTYQTTDPSIISLLQNGYDSLWNDLSPEEQAIYGPVLDSYEIYATELYGFLPDYYDAISGEIDQYSYLLSYQIGQYVEDYSTIGYKIQIQLKSIQSAQNEQIKLQARHELMIRFQSYFQTQEGLNKLKILMITVYDVLDSVIEGMDQNVFDLLMDILSGDFVPSKEMLTSENIIYYAGVISDLLTLIRSTLDEDDLANIKSLATDLLGLYIDSLELPTEQALTLKTQLAAAIDQYLDAFFSAYDGLIVFLDQMTVEKADAIVGLIDMINNHNSSMTEIIIAASNIIDLFASDGSVDFVTIANYVCEVYYDVQFMFSPDEELVSSVKAAVAENLTRILELASIIKDYDPYGIDAEGLRNLDELQKRLDIFVNMFSAGFDFILNPIDISYDHNDFIMLLSQLYNGELTYDEIESQIASFMMIFGTSSEEDTYYILASFVNYAMNLPTIDSFTEFQHWFSQVTQLGFSNSDIAGYLLGFLRLELSNEVLYATNFDDQMSYYEGQIEYYQDLIDYTVNYIPMIDSLVDAAIAELPEELQSDAYDYWNFQLEYYSLVQFKNDAMSNCFDLMDSFVFWNMVNSLDAADNFYAMEDDVSGDYFMNQFFTYFNSLNPDQQLAFNVFAQYREQVIILEQNLADLEIIMNSNSEYSAFVDFVNNNIDDYYYFDGDTSFYETMILMYTDDINEITRSHNLVIAMDSYLSDPDKAQLVNDVIVIIMDELENLVASASPNTFDILFAILMQSNKTSIMMVSMNPFESLNIDLSAEAIYGYSQDISTVLKALFSTLSEEDVLKVKTLIMDYMAMQMAVDGVSEMDIPLNLDQFSTVFDKYWPILNQTLGIVTNMLDGLTVEKIQTILDCIPQIIGQDTTLQEQVISVATIIDTLFADGTFDIQTMIDTALMIYFDVKYQFNYSTLILEETQYNFQTYIALLLEKAALIKDYDPQAITSEQMQVIYEAKNLVEYLVGCFKSPESITSGVTFEATHEDFVNLIAQFSGNSMSDDEIEQLIVMMTSVLERSEEDTFYLVLTYGLMVQSVQNISSVSDAQAFVSMLLNSELSKTEIAHYLVNLGMYLATNAIASSTLETDIADLGLLLPDLTTESTDYLNDYNNYVGEITTVIDQIVNPEAKYLGSLIWMQNQYLMDYQDEFQNMLDIAHENVWFDEGLLNDLILAYYGDPANEIAPDYDAYYAGLSYMNQDMYMTYTGLVGQYGNILNQMEGIQLLVDSLMEYNLYAPNMMPLESYLVTMMADINMLHQSYVATEKAITNITSQIESLENQLHLLQTLYVLTENEDFPVLLEAFVTMVLNQVDTLALNGDPDTINFIMELVMGNIKPGAEMTAADLVLNLQNVATLIDLLSSNLDEQDLAMVHSIINIVIDAYFNTDGENPELANTLIGIVDTYLDDALGFVPMITGYIGNLTEERVQTLIDQIAILNQVGDAKDNLSNFIRAVAIANIIEVVTADSSLNPDQIISVVFGAIFDVQYAIGITDETTTAVKVAYIQTLVNSFITKGLAIVDFDPYNLTLEEIDQIDQFRAALETMAQTIDGYFNSNNNPE